MPTPTYQEHTSRPSRAIDAPDVLDLSVVIVNYNVREFLEQALRSVARASRGLSVEVFVVDNNSADRSVEMVRASFPEVHVIANKGNVGFGKANNQAIRRARGRHLLILNPDTIVQENTFQVLLRFMDEHPEAGAAGCMIVNPDGTFAPESRRSFPTPTVAFYRLSGLGRLFPHSPRFGRYNLSYLPQDEVCEVDALSGSCMFVRRDALVRSFAQAQAAHTGDSEAAPLDFSDASEATSGAGLFDESFFMYGEDLDWCYRIQRAGWKIYYTPNTQIVHYKGESTKKGELRYVRLFYGAMLQFAEKHLRGRYSHLFTSLLRAGIFGRAALSVASGAARRLRLPLLDFAAMFAVVLALAFARSAFEGAPLGRAFYTVVAPFYALCVAAGTAVAGGYHRERRPRLRPVLIGVAAGLVSVAALSFFVKEIAFSRVVVALAAPTGTLAMAMLRLSRRDRQVGPRRAVLVGTPGEAERLYKMLDEHPAPPLELVGFVGRKGQPSSPVPRLAPLRQLRDVVRLHAVDEVIFAAADSSNQAVISSMRSLRDLPVQFKILVEGCPRVIGKASVENLTLPAIVDVDEKLGDYRSTAARRSFEVAAALLGLLALPVVWLWAALSRRPAPARLSERLRRMPLVLSGRLALVGYAPAEEADLPEAVDLDEGLFAVTESFTAARYSPQHVRRSYAFYAQNETTSLDIKIIFQALRNLSSGKPLVRRS